METSEAQLAFGRFRLDVPRRSLYRDGELVMVPAKLMDLLIVLASHPGEVVDKEEILRLVWLDAHVTDSSLTKAICQLRKVVGEDSIQTIPKRGYRFSPQIEPVLSRPAFSWQRPALVAACCATLIAAMYAGMRHAPARHSEADRNYLIGQYMWNKVERADIERSIEHFRRAIELNPALPSAQAGLADAYVLRTQFAIGDRQANLEIARKAATRAIELQPRFSRPRVSLAFVKLAQDFDIAGADQLSREALRLDPRSTYAMYSYACLLASSGNLDGAWRQISIARDLDPVSPLIQTQAARIEYYRRNFVHAVDLANDVLQREPGFSLAHYYKALSLGFLGRPEEALADLRQARLNPSLLETEEAWLRSLTGDLSAAMRLVDARVQMVKSQKAKPTAVLLPALDANRKDVGLWALEEMARTREIELLSMKVNPRLDSIRTDPRFIAVQRQIWPVPELHAQMVR